MALPERACLCQRGALNPRPKGLLNDRARRAILVVKSLDGAASLTSFAAAQLIAGGHHANAQRLTSAATVKAGELLVMQV